MPISPSKFYTNHTSGLNGGDILYIEHWIFAEKTNWIILSSHCDVDRRPYILLAMIKPIAGLNPEFVEELKKYKVGYAFYLPELASHIIESYVDYGRIFPFSREMTLEATMKIPENRIITSLTPEGLRLLKWHFCNHIARESIDIFASDIEGMVKQLMIDKSQ